MVSFTSEQMKEILNRTQPALQQSRSVKLSTLSDLKCVSCEIGLNVAAGATIAAIIAAGVVVGPELAGVVSIAEATGLEAATVAAIINGALAGGGATSVEAIIYELCKAMRACS